MAGHQGQLPSLEAQFPVVYGRVIITRFGDYHSIE